jgi:propanol-preferring alcohol dehydrogenase
MHVMALDAPAPIEQRPLSLVERPDPEPKDGEIVVQVEVCGVCRTDLHVVEGDLEPHRPGIVPGHEVVGRVARCGPGAARFAIGDRVGVAWLHQSCGLCRFCLRGDENLCLAPRFTGWDEHGGYGERVVVPEAFAYALPEDAPAAELAPLLCAGIIGYRAYTRSMVQPGGRLGLYGFGGSAHVTIQVARHHGCEVYVFSRGGAHRELAEELGANWVGDSFDPPPHALDGAILFAPAGELVPPALAALDRGGTLAVAGIHLSDVPALNYQEHLFQERTLQSVTANTRRDGRALLALAEEIPIRTHTHAYALADANEALLDLKEDRVKGAAVLEVGTHTRTEQGD